MRRVADLLQPILGRFVFPHFLVFLCFVCRVLNFWCRYFALIINLLHEAVNDANYRLFNLRISIQINTNMVNSQARSQKFAMGGAVWGVWGRSPQSPEANGGLGAKPPAAGGWGSGGKAPSRRRHGGLGTEPPALENFAFFCKNNFILGLF